jgi:hypothetical protein
MTRALESRLTRLEASAMPRSAFVVIGLPTEREAATAEHLARHPGQDVAGLTIIVTGVSRLGYPG